MGERCSYLKDKRFQYVSGGKLKVVKDKKKKYKNQYVLNNHLELEETNFGMK